MTVQTVKETLKLGLIGSGIENSKMPQLQTYLGDLVDIEVEYVLHDTPSDGARDLAALLSGLRGAGYHGVNVTHPFKLVAANLAQSQLLPGHDQIGSYNTLLFKADGFAGASTDYLGFVDTYRYHFEEAPGRVVMCGAGGVGRAIAFALNTLGVEHIDVFDLDGQKAVRLVADLNSQDCHATSIGKSELDSACKQADGLVNATQLGMFGYPGSPFQETVIANQVWAFDAVYTPLETQFLQFCQHRGITCLSGFHLWVFQGLSAFQLFSGKRIPADKDLINELSSWFD